MRYERILVTGGSGRIGRYVVRELGSGYQVTVLDRVAPADDVPFVAVDILDLDAVRQALEGHDAIIHLAALDLGVPAEPEAYFGTNVRGTWHVLQAAQEPGIRRIVLASSFASFGLSEFRPDFVPRYLPVDDAHPREPVHAYGVSKLVVEEIARSFVRGGGILVICLRPTLVLFADLLAGVIVRVADPEAKAMFAYVTPEDTARAFRLALECEGVDYDTLVLSAADSCSDLPSLEAAERVFGVLPEIRDPALYQANPHASLIDTRHTRQVIGFDATSSWAELRNR